MRAILDHFKAPSEKKFRATLRALGCYAARLYQPPHLFHVSAATGTCTHLCLPRCWRALPCLPIGAIPSEAASGSNFEGCFLCPSTARSSQRSKCAMVHSCASWKTHLALNNMVKVMCERAGIQGYQTCVPLQQQNSIKQMCRRSLFRRGLAIDP